METFKIYLESQGKSKSTVTHYGYYIADFLQWLEHDNTAPENVTAKEVTAYLSYLQKKGYQNKTRVYRLSILNHFFDHLIAQEQRTTHPCRHLKIRGQQQNKLYPVLVREQLESIYLDYAVPSAEDERSNRNWFVASLLGKRRNKVILGLMIYQGLTTSEVERIELNDLDLRAGKVLIKGSRKSNERILELKPGQIMDLMEYQFQTRAEILRYHTQPTNALFLSLPTLGRKSAIDCLQIWKTLSREIREQHPFFINFKQVRASVIIGWLNLFNLREVQYMAGHRYVSSTEKYLLHQVEDLQADIDKFHPMG